MRGRDEIIKQSMAFGVFGTAVATVVSEEHILGMEAEARS